MNGEFFPIIPILYLNYNEMNKLGIMIRKTGEKYPPNKLNLTKQMKTLFKKLKKIGVDKTEIAIEKDKGGNHYHTHLIISYDDYNNHLPIYDRLSKYIQGFHIKGKLWNKELRDLEYYDVCEGKFGIIHIQNIRSENEYRGYINKFGELLTLI
jgi:hypothetical protein